MTQSVPPVEVSTHAFQSRGAVLVTFRDRLVASDPGLTRLTLATRVTVAVLLSVVALHGASAALHVPVTVALLGAIVAFQASLAVNDAEPRTTTLLLPLPGVLGVGLGAVFATRGLLADLAFLVVLFGAVAVRARGPRWTAFGTIATMTYFFALFLGARVEEMPALTLAVCVGVAFSFIARFVLFADRPHWIARRTVSAFEARIRLVVTAAAEALAAPRSARGGGRAERHLQAAVQRLNETAASIESRLSSEAGDAVRIVFDAELAAEDLAAAALRLRETGDVVPRALRLALVALGRGHTGRAARIAARVPHDPKAGERAQAAGNAIVDLAGTIGRVDATAEALGTSQAPWSGAGALQQPPLRQAIQVTIAAAISIALGEALSPQRWYWAVLATYFVFSNTASSGETLARAWSRIVGTAVGVAAGIVAGHFAKTHPALDVPAIFVCLFLGVYLLRISYGMMIFFITALLALLYTTLGRFSDGVLGIRLAETAIGAISGGLAATLIFPTRTRDVVRSTAKDALSGVKDLVVASVARLVDARAEPDPLVAARVLEERVQHFVARAKPVVSLPALLGRGHQLRRWIVSLSACSYYGRALARVVDRATDSPHDACGVSFMRLRDGITRNIDAAAARVEGAGTAAPTSDTVPIFEDVRTAAAREGEAATALLAAAHLLERLDRTVARLARDERAIVDERPAVL